MSLPLTASQLTAALRAEGVHVVERPGWETHNRNHKGPFGPVHGMLLHHTASSGELASVELCEDGYAELPGPLCHAVIGKSGTVYLVGHGRANHAGTGDPNVMAAVIDERYGDKPPATHFHEGMSGGVDGNARLYGAECVNLGNGKDPWPDIQVEAMVRWSAALCRAHRWTAKSVLGHKEWSDWKPDPAGPGMPSMTVMRERIAARLAQPPSWDGDAGGHVPTNPTNPYPTPTPGATMTAPARTILSMPTDTTLLDGIPQTIYWTTEHYDDGSQHGAGGKTVVTNCRYNAVVNITVEGLAEGQTVQVWQAEENTNGDLVWAGPAVDVNGRGDGSSPVKAAVPFAETTYNRLVFVIKSNSFAPVTMTDARVSVQSWPN